MNQKLVQLEATPYMQIGATNKVKFTIEIVEERLNIELPLEYKNILEYFNGNALSFEKGARYIPDVRPSIVDNEGYLGLDFLYGVVANNANIVFQNENYKEQLPSNLITIGEVLSGDQICIDKEDGSVVYWWHEALTSDEETYKIAVDFTEFINKLEEEATKPLGKSEVIESESYLDF